MRKSQATDALETFCRNPWEFQQTIETPLKNLPSFVKTIVSAGEKIEEASLTIDQVVFEPKTLIHMFAIHSLPVAYERGVSLRAVGQQEVEELLVSVLSDWIDFLFIPEPQSFAIYADHDEYTTIYSHTSSKLDRVAIALTGQGFVVVTNYERRFSRLRV